MTEAINSTDDVAIQRFCPNLVSCIGLEATRSIVANLDVAVPIVLTGWNFALKTADMHDRVRVYSGLLATEPSSPGMRGAMGTAWLGTALTQSV